VKKGVELSGGKYIWFNDAELVQRAGGRTVLLCKNCRALRTDRPVLPND